MKPPADVTQAQASTQDAAQAPGEPGEGILGLAAQQLALTVLRRHLRDWISHEPGARRGSDPEELHQLRVAVRRIDATLGLFRHQIPSLLAHVRSTAKGVLRGLGAARDFDVQLAELRRYCADLPAHERAAAIPLKAQLEEGRARARTRMLGMLDSEATRHWLETLNLASADFAVAAEPGAAQAAAVMPERVRARFRKLRKAVGKLRPNSRMQEFHSVRRRAKQLRYAIECGAGLFGKPADDMLKALRRLQDQLGAHQDADMSKIRLAELAASGAHLPPETLFLMGRLAEHHLAETQQIRKTLERDWRKVRGRRWKALRMCMEGLRAGALAREAAAAQTLPRLPDSQPQCEEPSPTSAGSRPLRH